MHQTSGAQLGGLYDAEAQIAPTPAPTNSPSSAPCNLCVRFPCTTSILEIFGVLIAVEAACFAGRNTSVSDVAETTFPVLGRQPSAGDRTLTRNPGVSGQSGTASTDCAADMTGTTSTAANIIGMNRMSPPLFHVPADIAGHQR